MDVVHVAWGMCPSALSNLCTGKEGYPSIAYTAICEHAGRAFAVLPGAYGASNDQTIVSFNGEVEAIRSDSFFTESSTRCAPNRVKKTTRRPASGLAQNCGARKRPMVAFSRSPMATSATSGCLNFPWVQSAASAMRFPTPGKWRGAERNRQSSLRTSCF
mmetsp:Transcript_43187/g.97608  ORF Transcript_43187/g.97608 Transcript_43187/m.97608 type:complete len:160 (-) Transcript_43187:107-586(-)